MRLLPICHSLRRIRICAKSGDRGCDEAREVYRRAREVGDDDAGQGFPAGVGGGDGDPGTEVSSS